MPFDSLAAVKYPEEHWLTREQSEAHITILSDVIHSNLATKLDIEAVRTELKRDLKEMEDRLLIRLGSLMFIGISALAVLIKVL